MVSERLVEPYYKLNQAQRFSWQPCEWQSLLNRHSTEKTEETNHT